MTTPPVEVKSPRAPRTQTGARRARLALLVLAFALLSASPVSAAIAPKLRDALNGGNTKVRIIAIAGVARTSDPEAPGLLRALLVDAEPLVRAAAVDGLVALKDVGAVPALVALKADRDAAVRAVVERALRTLQAMVTVLDVGDAEDLSDKSIPGLLPLLQDGFERALREGLPAGYDVRRGGVDKGYGLLLKLRAIRRGVDGGDGFIEPKCDVTVVELPARALRFTSSAAAAATISGPVPKAMERELASDGIAACAPSLARDVVDFLARRPR